MATTQYNNFMNTQTYDATLASPTGLINSTTPAPLATTAVTPAAASTYTGAQATAANWDVKPNQTVQSQIKDIIAENSPLMEQAETRALQKANARGLMNSSIAVGAGQSALYDAAAPIAAADAATYARSGEFNAGAQQQVGLANQGSTNQANAQNSQLKTNVSLNNASSANDMAKFRDSLNSDIAKFNASESNALKKLGMDSQTKMELANIEASYKMLMQSSAGAADLYKQYMTGAAAIMANKDMDAATKATAIRNQVSGLNNGLEMLGKMANLNLGNLLTFDTPGAAAPAAQAATAAPASSFMSSGVNPPGGLRAAMEVDRAAEVANDQSYQSWRNLMQSQYGVSDPVQLSYDYYKTYYGGGNTDLNGAGDAGGGDDGGGGTGY